MTQPPRRAAAFAEPAAFAAPWTRWRRARSEAPGAASRLPGDLREGADGGARSMSRSLVARGGPRRATRGSGGESLGVSVSEGKAAARAAGQRARPGSSSRLHRQAHAEATCDARARARAGRGKSYSRRSPAAARLSRRAARKFAPLAAVTVEVAVAWRGRGRAQPPREGGTDRCGRASTSTREAGRARRLRDGARVGGARARAAREHRTRASQRQASARGGCTRHPHRASTSDGELEHGGVSPPPSDDASSFSRRVARACGCPAEVRWARRRQAGALLRARRRRSPRRRASSRRRRARARRRAPADAAGDPGTFLVVRRPRRAASARTRRRDRASAGTTTRGGDRSARARGARRSGRPRSQARRAPVGGERGLRRRSALSDLARHPARARRPRGRRRRRSRSGRRCLDVRPGRRSRTTSLARGIVGPMRRQRRKKGGGAASADGAERADGAGARVPERESPGGSCASRTWSFTARERRVDVRRRGR